MDGLTFKSMARFVFGESVVILAFAWIPSRFSLPLTALALFIGIVAPIFGALAYRWQSKGLRVVFQFCGSGLLYLGVLRMWDRAVGLSWGGVLASLAGLICAGTLPYVNKRFAGILYRKQAAPLTKAGRWALYLSLIPCPVVGGAAAMLGLPSGQKLTGEEIPLLFVALLLYLAVLGIVFFVMFRHANDLAQWKR